MNIFARSSTTMSQSISSPVKSFIKMKCPRCHHGDLFIAGNPYNLNKVNNMPKACPRCGVSFFPEPGFYYGAMYISYVLTVLICLITAIIEIITIGFNPNIIVATVIGLMLLLFPFTLRYSRVIWLYVFVKFDENAFNQAKEKAN